MDNKDTNKKAEEIAKYNVTVYLKRIEEKDELEKIREYPTLTDIYYVLPNKRVYSYSGIELDKKAKLSLNDLERDYVSLEEMLNDEKTQWVNRIFYRTTDTVAYGKTDFRFTRPDHIHIATLPDGRIIVASTERKTRDCDGHYDLPLIKILQPEYQKGVEYVGEEINNPLFSREGIMGYFEQRVNEDSVSRYVNRKAKERTL